MNNYKSRPIEMKPFSRSAVDIIIPFHAQYEKVSSLVRSILISVKSNPYQITLVDDCSENVEFGKEINKEFAKDVPQGGRPQVRCLRSDSHVGFGGALKLGFDATSSPWILFMHSDCLVENPNFMINMGRSLLNWRKEGIPVKMVSARADNPGDCIEAKWNNDSEQKDAVLNSTMPMFCCMCSRDVFSYIGGFVKQYPLAWYEDEELSYRMKKHGLLQGICGNAWVRHQGSATIKYLWSTRPETRAIMEANRERCLLDMRSLSEKNHS
jgi:GT2 family glycosyltransferase